MRITPQLTSRSISLVLLSALVVFSSIPLTSQTADALTGSEFRSGNIIDDNTFFNGSAMSAPLIQDFLNAKVPACDTNGTKMYNSTQTRAQYSASKGVSTPFTCLRDYAQNTPDMGSEPGLCNQYGGGQKSAAQIISTVAVACGVSPQTLLVLLQKEQSLVTDDWPWPVQYTSATGFGCPDTAPCDASYGGFFYQVYYAARQFKKYARDASQYNYRAARNNNILYNPVASCGSSNVYIENQSTAGLYIYTPYQPNAAALNNLYGSGDSCSAYGNRNFWRLFSDWFGSTHQVVLPGCKEATNTTIACVWRLRKIGSDAQVLVSNITERDRLVNGQGYAFMGTEFYGNVAIGAQPGNIPVFRLVKPDGSTFLTTDAYEKNVLLSSYGYTDGSVGFYADPAGANSGYPVYRLHSSTLNQHIWISSQAERIQLLGAGWSDEGIAFMAVSTVKQEVAPPAGKQLVYRFNIPQNHSHLWTTDLWERDTLIRANYQYEGVAWQSSATATAKPVYRLYAPSLTQHIYTTDAYEKDVLTSGGGWQYEGISSYVSPVWTTKPVYRLYAPSLGVHFYTESANERAMLYGTGGWKDEGAGWYQP